jgi:hypothetical protein
MKTMQQFEKETGIRFNTNMSGKMSGVNCLSTSNLCNPFCAARKKDPDSICSKCYAAGTCARYSALNANMTRNSEILTTKLFEISEMPLINAAIFRFEAFGDLINATQCINYFRLCKANPHVRFALWTKNPGIVRQALATEEKPENLIILLSSHKIGVKVDAEKWEFVDKTFTVYRKEDMPECEINCGARSCLACQRCYRKDTETEIKEYLK